MADNVLFSPGLIGNMAVKNRFVRSATYDAGAGPGGRVSPFQEDLFRSLARGGTGLIVSGIVCVHPTGPIGPAQLHLTDDDQIPGIARLAEIVHDAGACLALQLSHAGKRASWVLNPLGEQALAPSHVPDDPYFIDTFRHHQGGTGSRMPHAYREMSEAEIRDIIDGFGAAALRAREAGVDGVQVQAAHTWLLSQFLSPWSNLRTDQWGGSLSNRLRIHREIHDAIRDRVGPDYPVFLKLGVAELFPGGLDLADGIAAARELAEIGYDALEVSAGLGGNGWNESAARTDVDRPGGELYMREWCRRVKQAVPVPVILVGGVRQPAPAREAILAGDADFVSLSRPLIREPGLVRRWESGDAKRADCISCMRCLDEAWRSGCSRPVRCEVLHKPAEK